MKNIVVDLDGTITKANTSDYANVEPNRGVIDCLLSYRRQGFTISVSTARNMRTFQGDINKINIHTLPIITAWLDKHEVPYDEIIVGKPWCGFEGFYIDDKAIRPSEFVSMSYAEIQALLEKER